MRLPRTTGALSGVLIIILGLWGALIPFIGPYFHYAFGSYSAWHYTANRLWLDIVPGAVAVIGGLLLLTSTRRSTAAAELDELRNRCVPRRCHPLLGRRALADQRSAAQRG